MDGFTSVSRKNSTVSVEISERYSVYMSIVTYKGLHDEYLWVLDLMIGFIGRLYCNYTWL
jgi:hypothetical protein